MKIDIVEESAGTIVATIESGGVRLMVMAEVELAGRCLHLQGLHLHGVGVEANALGHVVLRGIVRDLMEALDVDTIVVGGARRTSGAGPGRVPGRLRFTRTISPRE